MLAGAFSGGFYKHFQNFSVLLSGLYMIMYDLQEKRLFLQR